MTQPISIDSDEDTVDAARPALKPTSGKQMALSALLKINTAVSSNSSRQGATPASNNRLNVEPKSSSSRDMLEAADKQQKTRKISPPQDLPKSHIVASSDTRLESKRQTSQIRYSSDNQRNATTPHNNRYPSPEMTPALASSTSPSIPTFDTGLVASPKGVDKVFTYPTGMPMQFHVVKDEQDITFALEILIVSLSQLL